MDNWNGNRVHQAEYLAMVVPSKLHVTKQAKCKYRYIKHMISQKQKSLLYLQVSLDILSKWKTLNFHNLLWIMSSIST